MLALGYVLAGSPKVGSAILAAALAAGFGAFTAVTIANEGVLLVWTNHTQNLWGVQVWWDLLCAVVLAVFLIAPRARTAGMRMIPWILFVAATASIGLLAMVARLFWLEARAEK
ncbi:hypothetical protein K3179_00600 [Qipengyuania sp. GH38]|nr:hypothetical protein [Qipengyuania intermedia]MBX7513036.1 hypothetical protein [Qipengyuania intermedia]